MSANDTRCPLSAPVAAPAPHTDQAAAQFFRLIYGNVSGWIGLSATEGDPDDRQRCRFHQDWFAYSPGQLGNLLAEVDTLAQRYRNVYVSVNVYERPRRDAAMKPGRAIFVDDLPAGTPASFTVQTSPDRQQGYFLLDYTTPIEVRRDLSRSCLAAGRM